MPVSTRGTSCLPFSYHAVSLTTKDSVGLLIHERRTLHLQQYIDLLIDALLDEGFTVDEANRLIQLREEYEERQAREETNYHRFVRWLVEHGRLSDYF